MNYLWWALLALGSYSLVAPMVSVLTRDVPSHVVALVINSVLVVAAIGLTLYRGDPIVSHLTGPRAPYLYLAGVFLTVGILSYYRALSLGPVSIVVPIFGLFIVTSSVIGVIALDEPLTARKAAGVAFAALAVFLTSVE